VRESLATADYATTDAELARQLDKITTRARAIKARMTSIRPAGLLAFDDPTALHDGEYLAWNTGPVPGGRPLFLVAPAYVIGGTRPVRLEKPMVFLKAPDDGVQQ
jgi:hypothetical protein